MKRRVKLKETRVCQRNPHPPTPGHDYPQRAVTNGRRGACEAAWGEMNLPPKWRLQKRRRGAAKLSRVSLTHAVSLTSAQPSSTAWSVISWIRLTPLLCLFQTAIFPYTSPDSAISSQIHFSFFSSLFFFFDLKNSLPPKRKHCLSDDILLDQSYRTSPKIDQIF